MLRRALAGVTAHVAFATRRRTARQLFRFALAEHESMLELRAAAARALLRRVAFGEVVRVWRRAGQGIAAIVYAAAMAVLYACLLPFAVLVRFADPERGGRWRVR